MRKEETMLRFRSKTFVYQPVGKLCVLVLLAAALVACGGQRSEKSDAGVLAAAAGSELFERLNCIHCHQMDGGGPGPSLVGILGETIPLENGERVTVDDQFIRTSILEPHAHTHAGYPLIMPSYKGRISEEELSTLVEYIQSLEK